MWLLVAIAAQFVNGSSAVIDKLLLKKSYPNPIGYTFWLGILGVFSLVFLPFGFRILNLSEAGLAFLAGIFFILAMLFYFYALFYGEASNSVILIGAISPVFTYIFSSLILGIELSSHQFVGFSILIFGGLILFFVESAPFRLKIGLFALASAFSFGLSNTLTKSVFEMTNFATGFIWIKLAGLFTVLAFLLLPALRGKILRPKGKDEFKSKWAYFLNRSYAGGGSVLIYYALLLGLPPLVDSTYNLKYVFIFLGGWLILRERFRGWALVGKIAALVVITLGILWLAVGEYYKSDAWASAGWAPDPQREVVWGVTFSQKFSEKLGSDPHTYFAVAQSANSKDGKVGEGAYWRENYDAIIKELKPKRIRLIAYWDMIEREEDKFDFQNLDYQMDEAAFSGARVILAVGRKLPRWPECHEPEWARAKSSKLKAQSLLKYIEAVVNRYKNHPALLYWQVENEPFLKFGECPPLDKEFLDEEITLVKSLDSNHPVLITDSGELGLWFGAVKRGDIFGTTMYRRIYNDTLGFIEYHLPPEFFGLKEKIIRRLTGEHEKKFIVSELAAEPWLPEQLYETALDEQLKYFDLDFFKNTIDYAKASGFDEYYLWGAEWWFWLKIKHNTPEFWEYAEKLLSRNNI
ncbi:MAG: EamA family transporter [Candidatus Niyogibacteria bacterium]|nr:MAG: EamA family transporter [Candidatus Niyogibacteria bacterium]